jgi:predicted GIY-YIG superfamily endonuclease
MAANVLGTCYLLHFERPYGHARHYLGWTSDLDARLEAHTNGNGSRLMEVVTNAGIGYELARTWENVDRFHERRLKSGGHARRCPLCRAENEMDEPRAGWRPHIFGEEVAA